MYLAIGMINYQLLYLWEHIQVRTDRPDVPNVLENLENQSVSVVTISTLLRPGVVNSFHEVICVTYTILFKTF